MLAPSLSGFDWSFTISLPSRRGLPLASSCAVASLIGFPSSRRQNSWLRNDAVDAQADVGLEILHRQFSLGAEVTIHRTRTFSMR